MNEPKLVEVYTTYGELQAQVIRTRLESAGIRAIFKNDALGTLGFVVDGLGEFKILVDEKDEQAAREVLEQDQQDGGEQHEHDQE
ncbi:MAG: DUF2007 domain-containing protein [Anaerolineae bacterium]|nr:DUF2007 domain-containing protein [Anaerolineae bacterium]